MSMTLTRNALVNFIDYRVVRFIQTQVSKQSNSITSDIGVRRLGKKTPRALIIYVSGAIPYYVAGNVYRCPILDSHAMYWEAAEMVRVLNERGFVVDFIDCLKPLPRIEWSKYSLVIDEGNNLIEAPEVSGQIRVFYCTGLHWAFHNQAELTRTSEFYLRNNLLINPRRYLKPNYSDHKADHIFYWANPDWMSYFHPRPARQEITTSVTFVPSQPNPSIKGRDFVWIGSNGAIHKGLDLAVEAIRDIPNARLRIFGHIESDKIFFSWLQGQISRYPNIVYEGIANFKDPSLHAKLDQSIGHIYPSCSEGGPGSVAQTSHFGLIPIVTQTANARTAKIGVEIMSTSADSIIEQLKFQVKNILDLSDQELSAKRNELIELSRAVHTREAYSAFFSKFINNLP